jgi:hypothetical protein
MTVDARGSAAALAARRQAAQTVDPTAKLGELHRTRRTRTLTRSVLATAAAVIGVVLVVHSVTPQASTQAPAAPGPSASTSSACSPTVQCLGGGRYRVTDLPVPVTVLLPSNFQGDFVPLGGATVEDYRTDVDATGVTVFENAVPVTNDDSWSRDPSAGTTAHSMATWLSKRPFLTGTTVTHTTVGGLSAWLVTADLKDGAPLLAEKMNAPAGPTFADGPATAAFSPQLTGDYTLVDVPGAGVTVIWSWGPPQTKGNLGDNQAYVDGLTFG